jgi:hypothetical protein
MSNLEKTCLLTILPLAVTRLWTLLFHFCVTITQEPSTSGFKEYFVALPFPHFSSKFLDTKKIQSHNLEMRFPSSIRSAFMKRTADSFMPIGRLGCPFHIYHGDTTETKHQICLSLASKFPLLTLD